MALVVTPGEQKMVFGLGIIYPGGMMEFRTGISNWRLLRDYLGKVDYFLAVYRTQAQLPWALDVTNQALEAGAFSEHMKHFPRDLSLRFPTNRDMVVWGVNEVVGAYGVKSIETQGFASAKHLAALPPRRGTVIIGASS